MSGNINSIGSIDNDFLCHNRSSAFNARAMKSRSAHTIKHKFSIRIFLVISPVIGCISQWCSKLCAHVAESWTSSSVCSPVSGSLPLVSSSYVICRFSMSCIPRWSCSSFSSLSPGRQRSASFCLPEFTSLNFLFYWASATVCTLHAQCFAQELEDNMPLLWPSVSSR